MANEPVQLDLLAQAQLGTVAVFGAFAAALIKAKVITADDIIAPLRALSHEPPPEYLGGVAGKAVIDAVTDMIAALRPDDDEGMPKST